MTVQWPPEGVHRTIEPFDEARFEYATTEGGRKSVVHPPEGDGWEEIDWRRDEFTDEALWRRPSVQSGS
jgi:hypothetical protein